MREIKYRAWVESEKIMRNDIAAIDFEDEILHFINKDNCMNNKEKREFCYKPYTLMQYTGLKDVNGKEIYEGDIVKNIGPHSPTIRKYGFGEFRYIDENLVVCKELVGITLRHVVDFKFQIESPNGLNGMSPNGWYGPKPPIDNEQFWNYQRSFEVIGNIFENPETLEVSNNV